MIEYSGKILKRTEGHMKRPFLYYYVFSRDLIIKYYWDTVVLKGTDLGSVRDALKAG